jgi:N-acetylglucosamine malate deacetylase 1
MFELGRQKLLIISPHPDDEVLGCGGLIKKVKDSGGKVYVLFLTVGDTDDYSETGFSNADQRLHEIESVAKALNYDDYSIGFKGNKYHLRLDQLDQLDMIQMIEHGTPVSLNKIKPTMVVTPHTSDYNQDHRAATQAVFAATRPFPDEIKPLQQYILGYESVATAGWWDSREENPNIFVSLTDEELETKLKMLSLYKSQIRFGSHPRSIRSVRTLGYFRGISAGAKAAEAYYCYRGIL